MAEKVEWNGDEISVELAGAVMAGLIAGGEYLLGASREIVPLEEGTLERSGAVSDDESELTVAVSYDTPYAVAQHEELTWRHAEGREAKYLEKPMTTERDTIGELVAATARRTLA